MRNTRRLGAGLAVAATCLSLGCAVPFSGLNPVSLATVAPAATEQRLKGLVEFNGEPLAGATMRAFDLATGRELRLIAAGGQNLTSASGRFDYLLPTTSSTQLVKLVAEKDGQVLVSLFDGAGNAVGEAPADVYRVQQTTVTLTVRVKLTAATTAAAKAFEGAFKLQFQLKDPSTQAGLKGLFARVNRAAQVIAQAFAKDPALAAQLAKAVNAAGELPDNAAFQAVIDRAGLLDPLLDEVKGALETFTTEGGEQEKKTGLDAISGEDFPLGRVEIATSGEFTYTDPDGTVVKGTVENTNLVPEPKSTATPAPASTPAPATTSNPRRRTDAEPTPEPTPSLAASGTIEVIAAQPEASGPIYMSPRPATDD